MAKPCTPTSQLPVQYLFYKKPYDTNTRKNTYNAKINKATRTCFKKFRNVFQQLVEANTIFCRQVAGEQVQVVSDAHTVANDIYHHMRGEALKAPTDFIEEKVSVVKL